ncbi:hypothetical protein [Rubrivirga litoralis]|uniref:Uncharacterized protein n=1 Tax=Rubrivirga litoralis TaxID=3075598 RepID=A0ABU3BMY4_9BACT|nr:hypothetical protein [Rubrivirga sp. F394]MDT0630637.1 hypothetical protein [Rubrivirga sp. F394]
MRAPTPLARAVLLLVAVVLGGAGRAEAQLAEGGARVLALGRAGVAIGAEPWGHTNPAALAGLGGPRIGLQASQAFGLGELGLASAVAALPTPLGVVGASGRTYGFSERRETRVVAGVARGVRLGVGRRLDVGVSAGVESAVTEGFESATTVLVGAGLQADLAPGLRAGLAARNLLGLRGDDLGASASTVPGVTVGVAYRPSPRALLVLDADQDRDLGLSVRAGAEAALARVLVARLGVSTGPVRLAGGVGLSIGALRADVAVERHESLGFTPAIGVEVAF